MKCRYCASEISALAKLCSDCGSYQDKWRTELKFWSSIVGLVALIVTGVTFSFDLGRDLYQKLFGQSLAISDISTTDDLRVWNISQTDIWITELAVNSKEPTYDFSLQFTEVIEPKEVIPVNIRTEISNQWSGTVARLYENKLSNYATDLSEKEIDALKEDFFDTKRLFAPDFLLRDGPEHTQQKRIFGEKFYEFECSMTISYIDVASAKKYDQSIPCIGTMRRILPNN